MHLAQAEFVLALLPGPLTSLVMRLLVKDYFLSLMPRLRIAIFLMVSALIHILIIVFPSPSLGRLFTFPNTEAPRLTVHFLSNSPVNSALTATTPSISSNVSSRSDNPAPPPSFSSSPASERFYEIQELDTRIRPRTDIKPIYPPDVDQTIAGSIVLDLFIDKMGKVQLATIYETSLPPEFGQSIIAAFLHQYFEPGTVNSVPVKTHLKIKVEFYPDNSLLSEPPSKIN